MLTEKESTAILVEARNRIFNGHKEEIAEAIREIAKKGELDFHLPPKEIEKFLRILSSKLTDCLLCDIARRN